MKKTTMSQTHKTLEALGLAVASFIQVGTGGERIICSECSRTAKKGESIEHSPSCRVGLLTRAYREHYSAIMAERAQSKQAVSVQGLYSNAITLLILKNILMSSDRPALELAETKDTLDKVLYGIAIQLKSQSRGRSIIDQVLELVDSGSPSPAVE